MVSHYLLSVLLTILICLGAGVALGRYAPDVFSLLNGGRLPGARRPSGTPTTQRV
jgi:hypothetical protein